MAGSCSSYLIAVAHRKNDLIRVRRKLWVFDLIRLILSLASGDQAPTQASRASAVTSVSILNPFDAAQVRRIFLKVAYEDAVAPCVLNPAIH